MLARGGVRPFRDGKMPSLRQLLAAHSPLLVIDAASSRVQAGWIENDRPDGARWATSGEETGVGLFRCVEALGIDLGAAAAFAFCDGPGSVLGIRTCAMALRTWNVLKPRPMFGYTSLALVAHSLGRSDVGVIADARRELWHHFTLGGELRRVPTSELLGELVMPENFRHWSKPPAGLSNVPYSVADLLPCVMDADLFRPTDAPDAFLHEEPSYVTWTPQIHRAPSH
jgi:tRNA threonylcarbamoyladenosine biosynthesis protein TsaB